MHQNPRDYILEYHQDAGDRESFFLGNPEELEALMTDTGSGEIPQDALEAAIEENAVPMTNANICFEDSCRFLRYATWMLFGDSIGMLSLCANVLDPNR